MHVLHVQTSDLPSQTASEERFLILNKEIDAHFVLIDDHTVLKSSLDRQIIKKNWNRLGLINQTFS